MAKQPVPYKRLWRSRNDRKIAGICGGLGEYFQVDPLWIRILFVLFFVAGGSALLVYDEVKELFTFADTLLDEIEQKQKLPSVPQETKLPEIFDQIKFYLEQEEVRGYAGWLLDENNIHNKAYDRIQGQIKTLALMNIINKDKFEKKSLPRSATQEQCQHESAEIARYILALAQELRKKPDMKFDEKVPEHARKILRNNAQNGRYTQYAAEIDKLHEECNEILSKSKLGIRESILEQAQAKQFERDDLTKIGKLLTRYQEIQPDECEKLKDTLSKHQQEPKENMTIPSPAPNQERKSSLLQSMASTRSFLLFGGAFVGILAIKYLLLPYFDQENASNTLSMDH